MGFGSSGIETTSSWSLWKTTREFIEKARRAAVVDGGLLRSANLSRDRQAQAEIQPSTTMHHTEIGARFQPPQRGTEGRVEKETKKSRSEFVWKRRNLWRTFGRVEKENFSEEREKNRLKWEKKKKKKKTSEYTSVGALYLHFYSPHVEIESIIH